MVETVGECGYDALTVRELARTAGVSTRTFYQHYAGKQDCFWSTHQTIVRRLLRSIAVAQAGVSDPTERSRRAVQVIAREWGRNPEATWLMLIEAYAAGPDAAMRMRKARRLLAATIGGDTGGAFMAPLLAEGLLEGLTSVACSRLLKRESESLVGLDDELSEWLVAYQDPQAVAELSDLSLSIEGWNTQSFSPVPSSRGEEDGARSPGGDRALLLSAVSKLAGKEEYRNITVEMILAAAGVSRRSFFAQFADVDDAFIAALELHAHDVFIVARHAPKRGSTPMGATCDVVNALTVQIILDPVFSHLCAAAFTGARTPMIRCRQSLVDRITVLIDECMPFSSASPVALEASAASLWGVIQNEVAVGRAAQVPQLAGALSYLVLAPAVGAQAAVEAIRQATARA